MLSALGVMLLLRGLTLTHPGVVPCLLDTIELSPQL